MADEERVNPSAAVANSLGAALVGLGVILTLVSQLFDGFGRGLLLGAGVMFVVLGVMTLSATLRRQMRGGAEGAERFDAWLPSRDGDR